MNHIDATPFRNAMSRLGASVHVITTEAGGVRHGLTASAVCSVTDAPPTLLFCINRNVSSRDAFFVGGKVCINTLVHDQKEIASAFANRELLDRRFDYGSWRTLATGAPMLEEAAVCIDGLIVQIVEVGTHSVVFMEVVAIHQGPPAPILVYLDRAYHRIPMEAGDA